MTVAKLDPLALQSCINVHCSIQSIDDTINNLSGGIIDYQRKLIENSIELSTSLTSDQVNYIDTFQMCLDLFKSFKELTNSNKK